VQHTRLVTGPDGGSRFATTDTTLTAAAFTPPAAPFDVSEPAPAVDWRMFRLPAGWFGDWHPAPCRQWFVQFSGEIEVVAGDGETRRFRAGDAVLVEDTTGPGHTTRVVGDADVVGMFVRLPE
jgi:quercetin dioxygenase-like cupin family protein